MGTEFGRLAWAWAILFSAVGFGAECSYQDNIFKVKTDAGTFSQRVVKGYLAHSIYCGDTVAAIYDGDDITVFDAKLKGFEWDRAANYFDFSQMAGSTEQVSLYDGATFWNYDVELSRFKSQPAASKFRYSKLAVGEALSILYDGSSVLVYNSVTHAFSERAASSAYSHARVVAGGGIAALYDGRDFTIFDAAENKFDRQGARGNFVFPTLIAAAGGAILYDGESVIGYCGARGDWAILKVEKDHYSTGGHDAATTSLWVELAGKRHSLNLNTCKFSTK